MRNASAIILALAFGLLAALAFAPDGASQRQARRIALGRRLFFDPILSEDSSVSCASCHRPELAFADTIPFSVGVHGIVSRRNTPSVMNMAAREAFFWDGRVATLDQQALGPIANPDEMNMPVAEVLKRLRRSPAYRRLFAAAFGKAADADALGRALQAYEETLETSATPNDRWLNDQAGGLTDQQIRGRTVFFEKGKCIECHFSPDFTGDEFRNIGLFDGKRYNDSGRYAVTRDAADIGKFKVPGLRNVAVTPPYMHDGSFKTLAAVIDYYDRPDDFVKPATARDTLLARPLGLNSQEKDDLEAFLHALTDDRFAPKK